MKKANPQGKGLVPVLEDWQRASGSAAEAKNAPTLLSDFVLSTLVLSARCDFRPVVGNHYYLYWIAGEWRLSLISPEEWGRRLQGYCVARCELRRDMTWSLEAMPDVADDPEFRTALARHLEGFIEQLEGAESFEDALPVYVRSLPYHRRLLAAGLAHSLRRSAAATGLARKSGVALLKSAGADWARLPGASRPDSDRVD